jgi:hypothetical protein
MMRRWWLVLLLLGLLPAVVQAASVHAFLDRNHVSLGDTVTLNITTDGSLGNPDLSALQHDFQVLGTSRSSKVEITNGNTTRTAQIGIALKPLHAGTLTIPALTIDGTTTQPLTLQVSAAPSGGHGSVGDRVFMEASVLSSSPYIGQQTVYTVRLFYQPGVHGSLSDPQANGAQLVQLDRDHRYMVQRNGYAYQVLERSWALVPDRSGTISVQGPAFRGQSAGVGNLNLLLQNPNALLNNPNALLNAPMPGFGTPVNAQAPSVTIDARAAPTTAAKPWLPARDVALQLTGLPSNGTLQAGVPLTVTLQISADGVPAGALPEPELPAIAGARVYPDQTRDATDASGEWLHVTRTRSFAIVPDRNGTLTIPAITLNWWDVVHDRAAQASVPAHTLQVSGAAAGAASAQSPASNTVASAAAPVVPAAASESGSGSGSGAGAESGWRDLAIAALVLWLLALGAAAAWWLVRRRARRHAAAPLHHDISVAPAAGSGAAGHEEAVPAPPRPRDLQREVMAAANAGDAPACEHALLAWARALRPAITNLGDLRDALGDPEQGSALDALQRARWAGGDALAACGAVVAAFANGFRWRDAAGPDAGHREQPGLPPLYPPR